MKKFHQGLVAAVLLTLVPATGCLDIIGYRDPILDESGGGTTATTSQGGTTATGGQGGTTTSSPAGGSGGTTPTGGMGGTAGSGGAPLCTSGMMEDCYDGPPEQAGVGACTLGTRTCQPEGMWGACENQGQPSAETCASEVDEDCDKAECAVWSYSFGDSAYQFVADIAAGANGDLVVLGYFAGTLNIVTPPLQSAGLSDMFLAKVGSDGIVKWAKSYGNALDQVNLASVAVDPAGNIFIGSTFDGTIDFGGGWSLVSAGGGDGFLVKLDPDGKVVWTRQIGGNSQSQSVRALSITPLGDVVIGGSFYGVVDFGDGGTNSSGFGDGYVAKYGPNNQFAWKVTFGNNVAQQVNGIAVDNTGAVLMEGYTTGALSVNSTNLAVGTFLGKIASSGTWQWVKSFATSIGAMAASSDNHLWITGGVSGDVDFGGGLLPAQGSNDVFLLKLDANGNHVKSVRFGSGGNEIGVSLVIAQTDNLVLGVQGDSGIDFGTGPLTAAGSQDVFISQFDAEGNALWARRFGDASTQQQPRLTIAPDGSIYLACQFDGVLSLGAGDMTSMGQDIAIAKLAP